MQLGTTFDFEYANDLGLDFKLTLEQIINLGLRPIRIGIKWNKVQGEEKQYSWEVYDCIFNRLNKGKIPTILQIGIKSLRWPEFYPPEWLRINYSNKRITGNNPDLLENLFRFFDKAIHRYKNLENLIMIQLENEPFLPSGPDQFTLSYELLRQELEYIRQITHLPILLTEQGLPTTGILAELIKLRYYNKKRLISLADQIGFNVYPKFEHKVFNLFSKTFKASSIAWKYLYGLCHKAQSLGKTPIISELQAEPWQIEPVTLDVPTGNKTCSPAMVQAYLKKLELIGVGMVLIWGTEFHIACKERGNSDWLNILYGKLH